MATKTLNIALDESLLKDVDEAVRQDMAGCSEYFRRLALADLDRRRRWTRLLNRSNEKGRKLGITTQEQMDEMLDGKAER